MEIKGAMDEIIPKRFDIFFDKHFGIGLRWDNWLYPLHLSIALPFITITIGIGKINEEGYLDNITDTPCSCSCGWFGTIWDCEPDIDDDGSLGCPDCYEVIEIYGDR